jgi:putative transposase
MEPIRHWAFLMPRRARLSVPGIPWHIIQRGNNRSICFYAEEDYQFICRVLANAGSISTDF